MKGFTIFEAVVAMMLTALLAILVIAGVGFYQRMFGVVIDSGDKQREINLFYFALSNDMEKADEVLFDGELQFVFDKNSVSFYEMEDDKIIRKVNFETDTFYVHGKIETVELVEGSEHLIGFIQVNCLNGELVFPVSVQKQYALGALIQNQKTWQ
ncbi:PulJ/GspJ family protein [Geofilum rubicundum]|uniref:Prepilin-type N-terminal cleavage/methylation domain-containing protein n=1 Tax=Geofilum rubicundum JCM 15548 TaxID=1236989 RepID=A0A0E9M3G5_9BACT|nr:hypothetical protein [Geofilum rubicundum]GAO31956.1 hypothetical protein JCM15548_14371 [Geofilum rubicundum JCM 15548]